MKTLAIERFFLSTASGTGTMPDCLFFTSTGEQIAYSDAAGTGTLTATTTVRSVQQIWEQIHTGSKDYDDNLVYKNGRIAGVLTGAITGAAVQVFLGDSVSTAVATAAIGERLALGFVPQSVINRALDQGDLICAIPGGDRDFGGPFSGLTTSSVARLTEIFPEELQSGDDLIVRQDDGLKLLSIDDLAAALGTTGRGWTPASVGSSQLVIDAGRRDTLFLDTGRTTPVLSTGVAEQLAGITDLSGSARHASMSVSGQQPQYNSADLVAHRNYIETRNSNDQQMDLAIDWTVGPNWTINMGIYVPSAVLKADWTFPILMGHDVGAMCIGIGPTGQVKIARTFGGASNTTTNIELDAWNHIQATNDTAVGHKVWVNGVQLTLDDIDVGRNYNAGTALTRYLFRDAPNGTDSAVGCLISYLYGNGVTFDADQVALANAWGASELNL